MPAQGLFVTGTDTGIGKTRASCLLIRAYAELGYKIIGMKPVASGASVIHGQLQNEDARALMEASNVAAPYALINPYCFAPAIAPQLGADQAGTIIDINRIKDAYQQLAGLADVVIVEGVGGWSVPLSNNTDVGDIALQLGLPVLMVVGIRLGCINHALLTASAVRSKGVTLAGWVANILDKSMHEAEANIQAIEQRLGVSVTAKIPFTRSINDIRLSNVFNIKSLVPLLG